MMLLSGASIFQVLFGCARLRVLAYKLPGGCKLCSKGRISEMHTTITKVPGIIAYTRSMRFVKGFFPQRQDI